MGNNREKDVAKMVLKLVDTDGSKRYRGLGYLYEHIADEIEQLIESGKLPVGAPLPNERRMAENLGVSLGTARRAVELLRDRRLVVTLKSKGTYVVSTGNQDHDSPQDNEVL
jgi:GntR family transcriptional regulator